MHIQQITELAALVDKHLKEMQKEFDEAGRPQIHSLRLTITQGASVKNISVSRHGNIRVN